MRFKSQESRIKNIEKLTISLSSPDHILTRSHGEATKPETINYRSFRPEKDGLFCEKIFGPSKDWECYCGKYKNVRLVLTTHYVRLSSLFQKHKKIKN